MSRLLLKGSRSTLLINNGSHNYYEKGGHKEKIEDKGEQVYGTKYSK
jgi:hypothetical protein